MSVTERPLSRCLQEDRRDEAMTCLQDPIVIANQLLLKCNMQNGSFIPQQIISLTNLLKELKKQQQQNNADEMDAMKKKRKISMPAKLQRRDTVDNDDVPPHPHPYLRRKRVTSTPDVNLTTSVLLEVEAGDENNNGKSNLYETLLMQKFYDQIDWVKKEKSEYVSMETLKSYVELKIFLEVMIKVTQPFAVQIKVNQDNTITITYQLIEKFKQQFMMIKIGQKHCLFLEPF